MRETAILEIGQIPVSDHWDKSLLEIAIETGFQSEYYFSKMFKKRTGLSPTNYRNCFSTIRSSAARIPKRGEND